MIHELRDHIQNMYYPINKEWEKKDRAGKIEYVCHLAEQYDNAEEVLDFIKNTGSNNFKEVFELIYDSDLFKG